MKPWDEKLGELSDEKKKKIDEYIKRQKKVIMTAYTKFITMKEWREFYQGNSLYRQIRKVKGGFIIGFWIANIEKDKYDIDNYKLATKEEINILKGKGKIKI